MEYYLRGENVYKIYRCKKVLGEISLSGAKNASLPIIVAACMCSGDVILHNIPLKLNDVIILIEVLRASGFIIEIKGNSTILFRNSKITSINHCVSADANKIRYSLLLLSLLLSRCGEVRVPSPGGCNLGDRRYDIHLESLGRMGADVEDTQGYITAKLNDKLHGADLTFHTATTSGSENVILAAATAEGRTVVRNANTRPEVIDLIKFLNLMGAKIRYSTRYIEVDGVAELSGGEYTVMSDCHEGISFMVLAGMTRGEVCIRDFCTEKIEEDVSLLRSIGMDIFEWGGNVYASARGKELKPFSMATAPYPGINSDMQPLFAALAATIIGESIVTDTRFTKRFQYVDEFKKLGINIVNYHNCAIIKGGPVKGCEVIATDLRAGAALIMLGCAAEDYTIVRNTYQVERGYENFSNKLNRLGCKVDRE